MAKITVNTCTESSPLKHQDMTCFSSLKAWPQTWGTIRNDRTALAMFFSMAKDISNWMEPVGISQHMMERGTGASQSMGNLSDLHLQRVDDHH